MRHDREGWTYGMDGSDKIAGADAEDANFASPEIHLLYTTDEGDVFPSVSEPLSRASSVPALEVAPSDDMTSSAVRFAAPSPDTVVVVMGGRSSAVEVEMRAREASLHEKYAAEISELHERLLSSNRAHAATVERLHAEYAAEVRRLVQALWLAQDAARAASKRYRCPAGGQSPGLLHSSESGSASSQDTPSSPARGKDTAIRLTQAFEMLQPALLAWPLLCRSWRRVRGNSIPPPR